MNIESINNLNSYLESENLLYMNLEKSPGFVAEVNTSWH